jgi:DNA invertase Pin-like site-specific DNA recombinase
VLHLYAALAEKERNLNSQRTNAALAAVKARGVTLGNPNLAEARAKANAVATPRADAFAATIKPILDSLGGLSANAMARELNARGVKTARGDTQSRWERRPARRV